MCTTAVTLSWAVLRWNVLTTLLPKLLLFFGLDLLSSLPHY